jgi:glycosyltransferase involved in cell wall biosynthesis
VIQVYGRFDGYWSHTQVSRGIVYGLHINGLDVQVCNVGKYGGYEGLSEPIEAGGYGISVPSGIAEAPVGFWVGGYPPQMSQWLAGHKVRVALVIAESSVVPKQWVQTLGVCHIVVVPSQWTRDAYLRAGVDKDRLLVVPHGIHPLYLYAEAQPVQDPPLFLHVCGSASFPQRKGTPQLIEAWRMVFPRGEARLRIRMMPGGHEVEDAAKGAVGVEIDHSEEAMRPDQMITYQCGSGFCGCIQPSRGEAFGIVPVEARAVGLPVILTHCAGHLEHASPRDIVVEHGLDSHLRCNGIVNGAAPTVKVHDIERALLAWKERQPTLHRDPTYARQWQWPEVTRKLAGRLRQILADFTGPRRIDTI